MLYLTCTMIATVDLAHYGVSRAKDWVSVDCGTTLYHFVWSSARNLDVNLCTFTISKIAARCNKSIDTTIILHKNQISKFC